MIPGRLRKSAEIDTWRVVIVSDSKKPMPLDAQILRLIDPDRRVEYILGQPVVNVGRNTGSDIPIDWPELSKLHCRLEWSGECWRLVNLDSANAIYVNGIRFQKCDLEPGDRITLAERTLEVDQIAVEELV